MLKLRLWEWPLDHDQGYAKSLEAVGVRNGCRGEGLWIRVGGRGGDGCGTRGGFLPRHDEDLREPLVRFQGSHVSMHVARRSVEKGFICIFSASRWAAGMRSIDTMEVVESLLHQGVYGSL